ncbi:MAG TPA: cadmium resistance transporter [Edaphobacter sp.]|nr:cadmium resistance transporter [Edaphobacter sp.]
MGANLGKVNATLTILAASVATFAVTNIDDIVLLTLFFARRVPTRNIVAGQYLGFLAIILLSCAGLHVTLTIPHQWIRVLGLVPLGLGMKQVVLLFRPHGEERPVPDRQSLISIALVTLSNGADNLAMYIPFFWVNLQHLRLILISYGFLVAVWCIIARWVGNRPFILNAANRIGHLLVPVVFIGLGIYIICSNH